MELLEGVEMAECHSKPRALFLFMDSEAKPDTEICSGQFPSHLEGKHCPFSDRGRMPRYIESGGKRIFRKHSTDPDDPNAHSCKLQKLGGLDQWREQVPLIVPKEMEQKMLYKCRQMFIVVLL
jgi:hypothetical protein